MFRQLAGVFVWVVCPLIGAYTDAWLAIMLMGCLCLGLWDAISLQHRSKQNNVIETNDNQPKIILLVYGCYRRKPHENEAA